MAERKETLQMEERQKAKSVKATCEEMIRVFSETSSFGEEIWRNIKERYMDWNRKFSNKTQAHGQEGTLESRTGNIGSNFCPQVFMWL